MRLVKWVVLGVVVLVIGIAIGAALDTGQPASPGAAAKSGVAQQTATPAPTRKLEKSTKRKTSAQTTAAKSTPSPRPKPPTFVACDPNIRAKAGTTTCAFAQNVFYEYWYSWNYAELAAFAAYSAAADQWFDMTCTGSGTVTCAARDGGEVRFPMSAVTAYTERNAGTYASDHTVSATPDDYYYAIEEPEYSDSESANCDPNYDGACLDPSSPDYDCEGGSGDGPDYTGRVEIVGSDPHGLDRDGDGVACEW